jgi:hypothetical protein
METAVPQFPYLQSVVTRMWSRLHTSVSHSDGSFFLLCYVSVCGPICALVYPIAMGRSSCCAMCLYVVPSMRCYISGIPAVGNHLFHLGRGWLIRLLATPSPALWFVSQQPQHFPIATRSCCFSPGPLMPLSHFDYSRRLFPNSHPFGFRYPTACR